MAASIAEEAEAVARATGNPARPYGRLTLAAWRGQEADARQLIAGTTAQMVAHGEGQWLTAAHWATAVLTNGLCRGQGTNQGVARVRPGARSAILDIRISIRRTAEQPAGRKSRMS